MSSLFLLVYANTYISSRIASDVRSIAHMAQSTMRYDMAYTSLWATVCRYAGMDYGDAYNHAVTQYYWDCLAGRATESSDGCIVSGSSFKVVYDGIGTRTYTTHKDTSVSEVAHALRNVGNVLAIIL